MYFSLPFPEEAFYSYKGFKSYHPLNVWWAEQEVVLHTEFRDGTVPAGFDNLRVLKEALEHLPEGMEQGILFPFPTLTMKDKSYKIFGLVTNREMEGEELIHWYWERCGKSEETHWVMKNDLAGGKMPSGSFGENAAWWWCMVLAFNLNALMKSLVLREEWKKKRMKAIRYGIINIPARIINHSRELIIQLRKGHRQDILR